MWCIDTQVTPNCPDDWAMVWWKVKQSALYRTQISAFLPRGNSLQAEIVPLPKSPVSSPFPPYLCNYSENGLTKKEGHETLSESHMLVIKFSQEAYYYNQNMYGIL